VDLLLITVIALVVLALVFDFTNGFHDAANSVATVVATRALPARWAPPFSAAFNFLAYFVVGTAVANTIAKTVKSEYGGVALVFAALFSAVVWNYVTWYIGMPSSSSHAIIGGLVGAGLAAGGFAAVDWSSVEKAAIGIVLSPGVRRRVHRDVPRHRDPAADTSAR
jgi:PiT family inorganic phosphate transporter